jgi:hypothetical protein
MTTNTISKELEIQIVRAWWDKLKYITAGGTDFIKERALYLYEIDGHEWWDEDCVEIVCNVYDRLKEEDDIKHKQNLLDKKAKLMEELAEINEQLGQDNTTPI